MFGAATPRRLRLAESLCRERRPQPPTSTPQPSGAAQPSYGTCDPSAMSRPLDDNGDPFLSLAPASQPATPSLVPDDYSVNTASPAPPFPPQRPIIARAQSYPSATSAPSAIEFIPFAVPTAPSTASTRRKRDRDDDAASTSSPSKRSRKSTNSFAKSCSQQLFTEYAGCCVCAVRHYLNAAHVVDKRELPEFEDRKRRGLVSIATLGDFDNAIYLCAADHAAFDAERPGLVIVPTFLDFFLEQERRWQDTMKTSGRYRSPVSATTYAEYCAAQTDTVTKGLYTAYPVVDYKRKDVVEPPTEFQWHGDPGAILFKAQKFLAAELSGTSRVPHMRDLKAVRMKLWQLRGLREEGDDAWAAKTERVAANETSDGPRSGPSGLSHDNGGDSPGSDDSPARTAPPSAPPSGSAGTDNAQDYSAPTAFVFLANTPLYDTYPPKRKRAASDCSEQISEDAVRVETPRKRIRSRWTAPKQHQEPNSTQHQQRKPAQRLSEPCRWGGPTSSTEETVRYWNAIFGHAYPAADRSATELP
ncbi:hypothetical protein N0V87_010494 [Didymella glomerata]|uniref:HNH nuclease domain-containing protein n=1 Tax=Didymella glomerata TaxID=749621 RepID=A0A9W9BVX2_9PLEO|nr:hypothetical protein N0V87_010494 [Didymella glomerata]